LPSTCPPALPPAPKPPHLVRFQIEQWFSAPLEEVEAAFLDNRFLAHLGELPKLGHPEFLNERREGTLVYRRVRYRFTGSLSPVARKMIDPALLSWVEESTTNVATHRTTVQIVADHYGDKLRCQGDITLLPDGDGTRRVSAGQVDVRAPLVGTLVERAIVSGMTEHAELEAEAFHSWRAQRS
jgi:uncharacterized protein DUF2505